jgi:hypothetical protein
MQAWQDVDAMWEADAAAEWERLNEPDQYEKYLKEAATDLDKAVAAIRIVIDHLSDASSVLSDTPMQAKVDSFIDSIEDTKYDLWSLKLRWERGERE